MIPVICDNCKEVFTACVVLGLVECPKCGGKEAHVFLGTEQPAERRPKGEEGEVRWTLKTKSA